MDGNKIIPYIEPIFRFCYKRLSNRCDAEDLAGEIVCHILDGMGKYQIESLDAWVWRVAHNRYARFIDARNKNQIVLSCDDGLFDVADYSELDEDNTQEQYETVFRYLHTLSSEYRNIFVDYYIGELSVRGLAEKYSLPETTIKWRLNVGRRKIRDRIGENKMDKVYQRINWDTTVCNGDMDSDAYLHRQIARAICLAAYEKPLTVEEISISTGLPTMYIEDELPRLENGPYPPRKDGGYGWFVVEETVDETENGYEYNSGCNTATGEKLRIYYYWVQKYFDYNVYHNNGTRRLLESGAVSGMTDGFISKDTLSDEDVAHFIKNNLITLSDGGYYLNIPYFTGAQFAEFASLFDMTDEKTDDLLAGWIISVRRSFEGFVPKHLHGQINQWMSCYLYRIIGYVTYELIRRGALCKPDCEKPLTCGVFCVEGESIRP